MNLSRKEIDGTVNLGTSLRRRRLVGGGTANWARGREMRRRWIETRAELCIGKRARGRHGRWVSDMVSWNRRGRKLGTGDEVMADGVMMRETGLVVRAWVDCSFIELVSTV
ncbi:hypothetical protein M0R45_019710 [Rubus argutus]|uniref:Uncharacterized protein n=1 Tax=Rubus argutus TaxID=59490 RepID=A0AAW1X726_RUBAR